MTTDLPPEIFELIIDALPRPAFGQNQHLIPLLWVSRIFRHLAHNHLFRSVVIKTYPSQRVPHDASLLLDILSSTPEILPCISCVRLAFRPFSWREDAAYARSWTPEVCTAHVTKPSECPGKDDPNFAIVLHLLASKGHVKSLEIEDMEGLHRSFDHNVLDGLVALRACPSLSSLSLPRTSTIPLVVVGGIPSRDVLVEMQLGRVWWAPGEDWEPIDNVSDTWRISPFLGGAHGEMGGSSPFPRLERLTLTDCRWPSIFPRSLENLPSWIAKLFPPAYASMIFPNLKVFKIQPENLCDSDYFDFDDWTMVANIVSRAPALENFVFLNADYHNPRLLDNEFTTIVVPALKQAPKLRSIQLTDNPCSVSNTVLTHLARLFNAMQPLAGPLESVDLWFAYRRRTDSDPTFEKLMSDFKATWALGWGELGRSLSRIKTLKSVGVAISFRFLNDLPQDRREVMLEGLQEVIVRSLDDPKVAVSAISEYS